MVYSANNISQVVRGDRLADIHVLVDAIQNNNGANAAHGLISTGSTIYSALQLTSVYNQIDIVPSGTGVLLPSTLGRANTPYQYCVVINNGANTLQVYGNNDTINNIAAATGVSLAFGTAALFISARSGAWFSLSGSGGGSGGISRLVDSVSTNTNAGATAGTDYVYFVSGTTTLTLPAPSGNTNRYTVKNVGSGTVTVTAASGNIDGIGIFLLPYQYQSSDFVSDGTNWNVI